MGGGSGGIIIRNAVMSGLNDPTVSGQLPAKMQMAVQAIFTKDPSVWTDADCKTVANAATWALCNLE
jgi:hypothetical protein